MLRHAAGWRCAITLAARLEQQILLGSFFLADAWILKVFDYLCGRRKLFTCYCGSAMVAECLDKVEGFFFVYVRCFPEIEPMDYTSCILREQCGNFIHIQYNSAFPMLLFGFYDHYEVMPVFFQFCQNYTIGILVICILEYRDRCMDSFGQILNILDIERMIVLV